MIMMKTAPIPFDGYLHNFEAGDVHLDPREYARAMNLRACLARSSGRRAEPLNQAGPPFKAATSTTTRSSQKSGDSHLQARSRLLLLPRNLTS